MNRLLLSLFTILVMGCGTSCASDEPMKATDSGNSRYFGRKKVLVAYFSWGGTTRRMAQQIQSIADADIFRIEPEVPYPTDYNTMY